MQRFLGCDFIFAIGISSARSEVLNIFLEFSTIDPCIHQRGLDDMKREIE